MSDASGKKSPSKEAGAAVTWEPPVAIIATIAIFFLSQFVVGILFGLFFGFSGWTESRIDQWVSSTFGQFLFIATSGLATVGALALVLRWRRANFKALGLARSPQWRDAAFTAAGFFVYFGLLILTTIIASQLLGMDTNKEQEIGFDNAKETGTGLTWVFLSLVVIPPIVEELVFRGFLFGGLRTKLSLVWATLLTSLLFAVPHLFATSDGLLWIAAVDTFVLSLVLCYVREKTGALWASIGIHAIKNGLAFIVLFVIQ